jgi:hypothetical protein
MANHSSPSDAKKFTMVAFIAFVVVFVFVMIMMLWHGGYQRGADGKVHYDTQVNEPSTNY